jgi:hypothetical protein
LTPTRKSIRRDSSRSAFRRSTSCWIAAAQRTASTALANSAITLSPAVVKIRPWCRAISSSITWRRAFSVASVPSSSAAMRRE